MKTNKKLGLVVAALIVASDLSGSKVIAASPFQLSMMQSYIATGDFAALYAFLQANSELLEQESRLGELLREFARNYVTNRSFAFAPASLAVMQAALSEAAVVGRLIQVEAIY